MEASVINSQSQSNSCSPSFLSANRFSSPELEISDIEMITLQSGTYTSLKDLLPDTPSSTAAAMSPMQNSSWNEIPIKNPLVKQAALAYLQPMLTPPEVGDHGFLRKLKKHGFGCMEWLSDILWRSIEELSGGVRRWE